MLPDVDSYVTVADTNYPCTHKRIIEFPTLPIMCCCTTLKNATTYTSSQKLLNKSAMHAVISLLLQSRKFWLYLLLTSSVLLHDVILLPVIRKVSVNNCVPIGQCTGTPRRETCGLQTAQISILWITRSWLSCSIVSRVYHRQIYSVDELKRWLIDVWCGLEQSIFDEAIDQWRRRHRACVHAKGRHFEYSLWIDNVDFVHICYIDGIGRAYTMHSIARQKSDSSCQSYAQMKKGPVFVTRSVVWKRSWTVGLCSRNRFGVPGHC